MSFFESLQDNFTQKWGQFTEDAPAYLAAIVVLVLGFLLSGFISRLSRRALRRSTQDALMVNFLARGIGFVFILLVALFALRVAGLQGVASGLFATAGASAVILGFAFRDIGENFISGVILSFNRPFNVNDTVMVGDIFGKVKTMEFRYTKIKTFDGRDVYIPNSDIIKKAVYNYTEDGYFRLDFVVGVAYEDDTQVAESVVLEAIRATEGVVEDAEHEAFVTVDALAASTVNLKAFFWVKTMEYRRESHRIRSEAISNVKLAIESQGLSMPADIREIKLYPSQLDLPVRLHSQG